MSAKLDKVKLVKARPWERMDSLDNIGVPTQELIKDAIKEGKMQLASDLAEYWYFSEIKMVRDADINLLAGFPCFIMERYGEDGLHEAYKETQLAQRDNKTFPVATEPKKPAESAFDQAMHHAAEMGRSNRMGREDGTGGFTIEEYDDRYEVVWDPCYSGGRPRRGDYISNTPAFTNHPFNYGCTKVPHWWTGGRTGVNGWCVHCWLLHEIQHVWATGGYLGQWVVGYPDDPMKACPYICYKDIDWIPEHYYTQLGFKKPAITSPNPAPKNPKLIKVTHSDELPVKYQNTMRRLRNAFAADDRKLALELVDLLLAEVRIHHYGTAIQSGWGWMDYIVKHHGYNELFFALRDIYSPFVARSEPGTPIPSKEDLPTVDDRVRFAAKFGRSNRSGPNCEGSVIITEEPERWVMELAPCGSGARTLIGDELDEYTLQAGKDLGIRETRLHWKPFTEFPRNLQLTSKPHDIAWNKVGIPHHCARCCAHFEHSSLAKSGYLEYVIDRSDKPGDINCKWYMYKDLDDVPEKYYERIGAKKPAVKAKK